MAKGTTVRASKVRSNVDAIGRAFAKDVEWKMLEAGTKSYAEVVRSLRIVEGQYLSQLKGHPDLALEIRRRIAENELEQALLHGCTLPVCRAKLQAASLLRYENVERKAHFFLLYARGALERGHRRAAKQTASLIQAELERSLKKRESPLGEQCLRRIKDLIDVMNNSNDRRAAQL
jgi:hypothetical protein